MAGLPLKSGADFYNLEAARLRLHNLGADPTEVGAGLIYFNTSTGLNTSQKVRLYTGSAWKTIAFSEDLDVASNADFLALKDKVDLLSGDVDTDNLINNLKDLEEFLKDFDETDKLKSLLDGKLNTSGGTIEGLLTIDRYNALIQYKKNGTALGYLGIDSELVPIVYSADGLTSKKILHEGNYSDYVLPLSGGFMNNNASIKWNANVHSWDNAPDGLIGVSMVSDSLGYYGGLSFKGYYGIQIRTYGGDTDDISVRGYNSSNWGTWRTIIHSGNVGKYNAGSAQALTHSNGTVGAIVNSSGNVTIGGSDLAGTGTKLYVDGSLRATGLAYLNGGAKLANATYISSYIKDDNGSTTTTSKSIMSVNASNNLLIAYGLQTIGKTGIYGKEIYFAPNGEITKMLINSSGNVLIGTTTDNGAKLQVSGAVQTNHIKSLSGLDITAHSEGEGSRLFLTTNAFRPWGSDNGKIDLGSPDIRWRTLYAEGAYIAQGAIIKGDLHVSGNIIADGEVSAGGAGTEGGGSSSGGGGAFHSEGIAVGATQTTIAHGLGTDDIVVSIYEKDGVSGRWSIILTDVEIVDANNIIVSFGSATTVEHKVVIMGAVA